MKSYSTLTTDFGILSQNSTSNNVALGAQLINDALRYLTGKFPIFNERSYVVSTVAQQQYYNLPPQVKNLINVTVKIGGVLWLPKFAANRDYWDSLNVITFYQDFPSFFYTFNGQLGLFPIPATTGNTITMNYKVRLRDLSQPDYTAGTVSVTNGSPTITGSGTTFIPDMVGRWIQITPPNGDGQWYQIMTYNSATSLTLDNNYTGITGSGLSFTIGEMPLLSEDYQDLHDRDWETPTRS